MKLIRLKLMVIFFAIALKATAQDGSLFHIQYDSVYVSTDYESEQPNLMIYLDFDRDGVAQAAFDFCFYEHPNSPPWINLAVGDTTGSWLDERWRFSWSKPDENVLENAEGQWECFLEWDPWNTTNTEISHNCVAMRKAVEGGCCYGWLNLNTWWDTVYSPNTNVITKITMSLRIIDFAFCTIPNYSLKWGQTSLTGVGESGTVGSASVVPNPTTGVFTVTGENLNLIEVYDVLGQRITSLTANSDQTTIDLSGQPAGIYLVNVTDLEGKHCVKKVVKQ